MTEAFDQGPVLRPASEQIIDLPLDETDFGVGQFGDDVPVDEETDKDPAEADLDERAREDFSGLMHLGYLEEECEIAQHRFLLKTPTHDERLERGLLHRPHIGTTNFEFMWELLTVAAYLHRIDSVSAPEPLGMKPNPVATRLDWIKQNIRSSVLIRLIYNQTVELDARERAVVEYLDDQSKS